MIESLLLTAGTARTFEERRLLANASSFFAIARPMRTRIAALLSLVALAIGSVSPSLAQSPANGSSFRELAIGQAIFPRC
jgi:hypothetical protein